ncbi:Asp-tRNA(Asn)/Glu-tRNA(Gln) amidotransferase subunit GatA [Mesoterricola silvestris]|uniref:Glutamyl-tRNA(Gln) amidotransferase subunit A n=1 Tax=Mesoterricola silvestris TaxID=2927979 RepID=A0AA48GY24_9BACT|nr:Asp-tRNA(Asn)/Glu-tRNA(Gln) amidotransferase subunit GatA [Mesoterricola silvestris]BDU72463.1 glutamyl-tRNA(Gln) amidotransferase subunit A [Mesoterricola silvestris]
MGPGSLADLREGLEAGDLSAEFLALRSLDRMARLEPRLNATASLDRARTLAAARDADARLARGERSPVLGIPVVLKDNLNWKGAPVGNGSRIQRGYRAPYDATVVRRLLEAGAVPVAKANMDEFAMGSSGEHSASGPARNPWDLSRVPGGSSSGSVVAVAAGYAPLALGTDTGGSVRLPGSFCNVTALRPTYGALSRYGVTAMASSLDIVGPVAASARDLAAALSVMAGSDPLDATSVDLPGRERLAELRPRALKGLRIGLPRECFGEGIEEGVRGVLEAALRALEAEGAELVEVSLPHTRFAIDTYYLITTSEVSSNLARFDGVRFGARTPSETLDTMVAATRDEGFGMEAKRRILLGAFCLSRGYYEAFYLKAQKARTLILRDFTEAFGQVDVLATPVCPGTAFPLGDRTGDPLSMYLSDVFTVTPSLAALPALSMPAGFASGLPVGLQLIGPSLSDVSLLELAHAYQQITKHHTEAPRLDC